MGQASLNSWNLLSFIGLETSHRRGPEKRSTKDMIKNIIRGMATGVNFLQLWGEERVLIWEQAPLSYEFNQNAYLKKPL